MFTFSPDGQWLATGDTDGYIYLWSVSGAEPATCVQTVAGHSNRVTSLAFAPDGRTLASANADGNVKLWEVPTGPNAPQVLLLREILPGVPMNCVAWSPDGLILACGGQDPTIWLWDVTDASYSAVLRGHTGRVRALAFTPDGRSLFSGGVDGTLRVWDVQGGKCTHVMQGHVLSVIRARWSPDGKRLASANSDQIVTIFDLNGEKEARLPPRLLSGHHTLIVGLTWSPDGRWIASAERGEGAIRLWDANSEACMEVLRDVDDASTVFDGLSWSPDGRWLASATQKHGVLLWDMSDMATPHERPARRLPGLSIEVLWSPGGTWLASLDQTSGITVWASTDGTLLRQLDIPQGRMTDFGCSPNGQMLISSIIGGEDGAFAVWDARSGARIHTFGGPDDVGMALAWGSSDKEVVSADTNGDLRWWNIETGECIRKRKAHQGYILDLNRSHDGLRLASCGIDGAIMIWDLRTGEYLETVRRDRPYERLDITGIRGLTEAQKATLRALGATEAK